ncbi:MAG: HPP family protein [Dehalococcoidia bacterium]|nr:HPP family protein [Dehalococcoidia bacterium]
MSNRPSDRPRLFHRPNIHMPHLQRPDLHGVHIPHPHIPHPHFRPETIWFLFDKNLKPKMKNYLFQCGLAILSLIVILMVQSALFSEAIVVSVASAAFTIFVFPDSIASTPRRVIGGQIVAILAGAMFFAILNIPALESAKETMTLMPSVAAALAVGLSILIMVATNTEHPPAAGVALGIVIDPWQWSAIAFVLIGALALSVIRVILKPKMINLL